MVFAAAHYMYCTLFLQSCASWQATGTWHVSMAMFCNVVLKYHTTF